MLTIFFIFYAFMPAVHSSVSDKLILGSIKICNTSSLSLRTKLLKDVSFLTLADYVTGEKRIDLVTGIDTLKLNLNLNKSHTTSAVSDLLTFGTETDNIWHNILLSFSNDHAYISVNGQQLITLPFRLESHERYMLFSVNSSVPTEYSNFVIANCSCLLQKIKLPTVTFQSRATFPDNCRDRNPCPEYSLCLSEEKSIGCRSIFACTDFSLKNYFQRQKRVQTFTRESISLKFRTSFPGGLLLYTRTEAGYQTFLFLDENGMLNMISMLGNKQHLNATIQSLSLADNNWHYLKIDRTPTRISFNLNNFQVQKSFVFRHQIFGNRVYFGDAIRNKFGDIFKLTNGKVSRALIAEVTDVRIQDNSGNLFKMTPDGSFDNLAANAVEFINQIPLNIGRHTFEKQSYKLEVLFRTTQSHGLLFLALSRSTNSIIALFLEDGHLKVTVIRNNDIIDATITISTGSLSDGYLHSLSLSWSPNGQPMASIDDIKPSVIRFQGAMPDFTYVDVDIYAGSPPQDFTSLPHVTRAFRQKTPVSFRGCLFMISVDDRKFPLNDFVHQYPESLKSGCTLSPWISGNTDKTNSFVDACSSKPCRNGVCIPTETSFICDCSGVNFYGRYCEIMVNVLDLDLYRNFLIVWNSQFNVFDRQRPFTFNSRTIGRNGVIAEFSSSDRRILMRLVIRDGVYLSEVYKDGQLRRQIKLGDIPVSDGNWHTTSIFKVNDQALRIQLDDNTPTTIDFGYVLPDFGSVRFKNEQGDFIKGDLQKIFIVNTPVIEYFIRNSLPPYLEVQSDFRDKMSTEYPRRTTPFKIIDPPPTKNIVTYRTQSARSNFPSLTLGNSYSITFQFRTDDKTGVLFYFDGVGKGQFIIIELREGVLFYTYDHDGTPIEIQAYAGGNLNDNKWHKVSIWKNETHHHSIIVSGIAEVVRSKHVYRRSLSGNLFIGGAPAEVMLRRHIDERYPYRPFGYRGCLAEVVIDGRILPLYEKRSSPQCSGAECDVVRGCVRYKHCYADLCKNGGTCVEQVSSFHCLCTSSFIGSRCEQKVSQANQGLIIFRIPDAGNVVDDSLVFGFSTRTLSGTFLRLNGSYARSNGNPDYYEFRLENGRIVLYLYLGYGGNNDPIFRFPLGDIFVSDGGYHVVKLMRYGNKIRFFIDGEEVFHPDGLSFRIEGDSIFHHPAVLVFGGRISASNKVLEYFPNYYLGELTYRTWNIVDLIKSGYPGIEVIGSLKYIMQTAVTPPITTTQCAPVSNYAHPSHWYIQIGAIRNSQPFDGWIRYDMTRGLTEFEKRRSDHEDFKVSFRTKRRDALLWHMENDDRIIFMGLQDGYIRVIIDFRSGIPLSILVKPDGGGRYSDDKDHDVTLIRKRDTVHVNVDNDPSQYYVLKRIIHFLDNGILFLGGAEDPGKMTHQLEKPINSNFHGYIKEAMLRGNGLCRNVNVFRFVWFDYPWVTLTGEVKTNPPRKYKITTTISVPKEGSLYFTGTSHLKYHFWDIVPGSSKIELTFQTKNPKGLLFYAPFPDGESFIAGEIFDGKFYCVSKFGDNAVRKSFPLEVSDGSIHRVSAQVFDYKTQCSLGTDVETLNTQKRIPSTDKIRIYLGGFTDLRELPWWTWSKAKIGTGLKGNLKRFTLNSLPVSLLELWKNNSYPAGIRSGVTSMPQDCNDQPCVRGECIQFMFTSPQPTYYCDCVGTGFTGKRCEILARVLDFDGTVNWINIENKEDTHANDISLEFRSDVIGRDNPLFILKSRDGSSYLKALIDKDGKLVLFSRLGGQLQEYRIPDGIYNDYKWHNVKLLRRANHLHVLIDNDKKLSYNYIHPGKKFFLHVYRLGVGTDLDNSNFTGQIRNVYVDNSARVPPEYWPDHDDDSITFHGGSLKINSRLRVGPHLSFFFKTKHGKGLLFAFVKTQQQFILFQIVDSRLEFLTSDGDRLYFSTPRVDDDQWHHVKLFYDTTQRMYRVFLDGSQRTLESRNLVSGMGDIYLGGFGSWKPSLSQVGQLSDFIGCVKNLRWEGNKVGLKARVTPDSSGLLQGCSSSISPCLITPRPCNGGKCYKDPNDETTYRCDCTGTGFVGARCDEAPDYGISYASGGSYPGLIVHTIKDRPSHMTKSDILVGFQSAEPSGSIFRLDSGNSDDYYELRLDQGQLIFLSSLNGRSNRYLLSPRRFNDKKYHVVKFTKNHTHFNFALDGGVEEKAFSSRLGNFRFPSRLLAGGKIDPSYQFHDFFYGIVPSLVYNNNPIVKYFREKDPSILWLMDVLGQDLHPHILIPSNPGKEYKFDTVLDFNGNEHVTFLFQRVPELENSAFESEAMDVRFKTLKEAYLFKRRVGQNQMSMKVMKNGIELAIDSQTFTIPSDTRLTDGKWHTVTLVNSNGRVGVSIDYNTPRYEEFGDTRFRLLDPRASITYGQYQKEKNLNFVGSIGRFIAMGKNDGQSGIVIDLNGRVIEECKMKALPYQNTVYQTYVSGSPHSACPHQETAITFKDENSYFLLPDVVESAKGDFSIQFQIHSLNQEALLFLLTSNENSFDRSILSLEIYFQRLFLGVTDKDGNDFKKRFQEKIPQEVDKNVTITIKANPYSIKAKLKTGSKEEVNTIPGVGVFQIFGSSASDQTYRYLKAYLGGIPPQYYARLGPNIWPNHGFAGVVDQFKVNNIRYPLGGILMANSLGSTRRRFRRQVSSVSLNVSTEGVVIPGKDPNENKCLVHNPCQNGAACIPSGTGSQTCKCASTDFKGEFCEIFVSAVFFNGSWSNSFKHVSAKTSLRGLMFSFHFKAEKQNAPILTFYKGPRKYLQIAISDGNLVYIVWDNAKKYEKKIFTERILFNYNWNKIDCHIPNTEFISCEINNEDRQTEQLPRFPQIDDVANYSQLYVGSDGPPLTGKKISGYRGYLKRVSIFKKVQDLYGDSTDFGLYHVHVHKAFNSPQSFMKLPMVRDGLSQLIFSFKTTTQDGVIAEFPLAIDSRASFYLFDGYLHYFDNVQTIIFRKQQVDDQKWYKVRISVTLTLSSFIDGKQKIIEQQQFDPSLWREKRKIGSTVDLFYPTDTNLYAYKLIQLKGFVGCISAFEITNMTGYSSLIRFDDISKYSRYISFGCKNVCLDRNCKNFGYCTEDDVSYCDCNMTSYIQKTSTCSGEDCGTCVEYANGYRFFGYSEPQVLVYNPNVPYSGPLNRIAFGLKTPDENGLLFQMMGDNSKYDFIIKDKNLYLEYNLNGDKNDILLCNNVADKQYHQVRIIREGYRFFFACDQKTPTVENNFPSKFFHNWHTVFMGGLIDKKNNEVLSSYNGILSGLYINGYRPLDDYYLETSPGSLSYYPVKKGTIGLPFGPPTFVPPPLPLLSDDRGVADMIGSAAVIAKAAANTGMFTSGTGALLWWIPFAIILPIIMFLIALGWALFACCRTATVKVPPPIAGGAYSRTDEVATLLAPPHSINGAVQYSNSNHVANGYFSDGILAEDTMKSNMLSTYGSGGLQSYAGFLTLQAAEEIKVDSYLLTSNNQYVVTASSAGPPQVWNMKTGELELLMSGDFINCTDLHLACDDKLLVGQVNSANEVVSGTLPSGQAITSRKLQTWDFITGLPLEMSVDIYCTATCLMSDKNRIAVGRTDSKGTTISVFNILTGEVEKELNSPWVIGNADAVCYLGISHDDRYVVAGFSSSVDNTANFVIFDLTYGQVDPNILILEAIPSSTVILPNYEAITGTRQGELIIWSLKTGKPSRQLMLSGAAMAISEDDAVNANGLPHEGEIKDLFLSKDNQYLISASGDYTLKLWDMKTELYVRTFFGHADEVWTCCASTDNDFVVSGSRDGTIRLWRLRNGNQICSFDTKFDVFSVKFSSDKKIIVALGDKFASRKLILLQLVHTRTKKRNENS